MKTNLKTISLVALGLTMVGTLALTSCKKKTKEEEPAPLPENDPVVTGKTYAVHGSSVNNTARFVLQTGGLTGGSVTAVGKGADVTAIGSRPNNMMVKNGFYYNLNNNNNRFSKYRYENDQLVLVKEIPFNYDFNAVRSSAWIDDNTLLVSGENSPETEILYAIIDLQAMNVISNGAFPLPAPPVANHILQAGTTFKRGNRFFIGYSYYANDNVYAILDTAYVTIVDYPAMTNPVHIKDARSAGAGGGSNLSWSVVESTGDIYLMTCPGDLYGHTSKPTGILKIKNGQEAFDPGYFFNLSSYVNNNDPLTITSVGNGKVITKNVRQDLIAQYSDFTLGFIYEYYVADLYSPSMTKINTPLHKGLFNNVLYENGKAYFPNTSQSNGVFVYEYDPSNGNTSKGLEIKGLDIINWVRRVQ